MRPHHLAIAAGRYVGGHDIVGHGDIAAIGHAPSRPAPTAEPMRFADQAPLQRFHGQVPVARMAPVSAALIRAFDIVSASLLLLAVLPFLILLAIALQIDSPGRLFFVQQRVGRGGQMFPCIKFRTMCENADQVLQEHLANDAEARAEWDRDFKLTNDPRVTRLGKLIRRFSLDEFPQLLSIIVGQMSVVGPRPIVPAEIERYGRFIESYASVRPGLTGLWQVSGRNDVSYSQRVAFDCEYVLAKSLLMDLSIVLRTIPAIVLARGAY